MTNYECENRISDDEIISSLEVIATTRNCSECKIRNCNWGDCNCSQITANAALDLINQLQVEIERLKIAFENLQKTSKYWHEKCGELVEEVQTAQSEAYKEFAERLKEKALPKCDWDNCVDVEDIDKLLKEMVGDTE